MNDLQKDIINEMINGFTIKGEPVYSDVKRYGDLDTITKKVEEPVTKKEEDESDFSKKFNKAIRFTGRWEMVLRDKNDGILIPLEFSEDPNSWNMQILIPNNECIGTIADSDLHELVDDVVKDIVVLKDNLIFDIIEE